MSTADVNEDRLETLILLRSTRRGEFEAVLRAIQLVRGRVLHAVPPISVMAFVPALALGELRTHPAVELVETGPIGDERREKAPPEVAEAIYVWNEHLRSRERTSAKRVPEEPLSWDAPGRLPPDPPQRVLETLRRRERELLSEGKDTPGDD